MAEERLKRRFDEKRQAHIVEGTIEDIRILLDAMWEQANTKPEEEIPDYMLKEKQELMGKLLTSFQPHQWRPYGQYSFTTSLQKKELR